MPSEPPPDDLLHAAERAYAGLPITIEEPTAEELAARTRRFSYTEGDKTISGLVHTDADGNPALTELTLRPSSPHAPVTASMLISVRVGEITASLRTLLALDRARREGAGVFSYAPTPPPAAKQPRRGGRPSVTDSMLEWLAEAYIMETEGGTRTRPLARIAERIGRPEETVRTWLAKARKEGWLAPGVRGRAGGQPGPKLLAKNLEALNRAVEAARQIVESDPETVGRPKAPGRLVLPGHYSEEYMRQQGVID